MNYDTGSIVDLVLLYMWYTVRYYAVQGMHWTYEVTEGGAGLDLTYLLRFVRTLMSLLEPESLPRGKSADSTFCVLDFPG